MFSLNHILFMLGTFLSTYYISNWLKDKSVDFVDKYMKFFTVVVLAFDPIYWIWEWNTYGGVDLSTTLPLYICSLFWIMLPLAVFSKNEALKRSAMSNICSVGFLGGVFGLVFNTHLNYHPFFSFVPMRSLLYHFLMILISMTMLSTGYYKVKSGDANLAFIPFMLILIPSVLLNLAYGWDYCFTGGGIGTPLESISSLVSRPTYFVMLYGAIFGFIHIYFKLILETLERLNRPAFKMQH